MFFSRDSVGSHMCEMMKLIKSLAFLLLTLMVFLNILSEGVEGFRIFTDINRSQAASSSIENTDGLDVYTHTKAANQLIDEPLSTPQKRAFLSDAGYGSRVYTAFRLAKARRAYRDLFGRFGPGR